MAKRSVALKFSCLLHNRALNNPMDATFRGFPPSIRTPKLSLLCTPFCSTSSSTAVRHLLAELDKEWRLKSMESDLDERVIDVNRTCNDRQDI